MSLLYSPVFDEFRPQGHHETTLVTVMAIASVAIRAINADLAGSSNPIPDAATFQKLQKLDLLYHRNARALERHRKTKTSSPRVSRPEILEPHRSAQPAPAPSAPAKSAAPSPPATAAPTPTPSPLPPLDRPPGTNPDIDRYLAAKRAFLASLAPDGPITAAELRHEAHHRAPKRPREKLSRRKAS